MPANSTKRAIIIEKATLIKPNKALLKSISCFLNTSIIIGIIIGFLFVSFQIKVSQCILYSVFYLAPVWSHCCLSDAPLCHPVTHFASSIRLSELRTYTNPLDTISGPASSCPEPASKCHHNVSYFRPTSYRRCLSRSTIFPTSP